MYYLKAFTPRPWALTYFETAHQTIKDGGTIKAEKNSQHRRDDSAITSGHDRHLKDSFCLCRKDPHFQGNNHTYLL